MSRRNLRSIELFTGAGGLALGLEAAGWEHVALLERDADACATIRLNNHGRCSLVHDWRLLEGDVRAVRFSELTSNIELVAGGPPCQPFSLGGKHRGSGDHRDMFPEAVRAVRELTPRVFVFENVKGLLRQSFSRYLGYVILQLTYPTLVCGETEMWQEHLARLERHHTSAKETELEYRVVFRLLNAADYGVPQYRHRVFIVGFRKDVGREWSFPKETHNLDKLLWEQWVTGEYWDDHKVARKDRPQLPEKLRARIARLKTDYTLVPPSGLRYQTVRDALRGIPDPRDPQKNVVFKNHEFRPGARAYPGHTGSNLDEPSKTLKAGDHGVPGGENMLRLSTGELRYFTVRESARLQTFPDDYEFSGSWTECMRQIGNAVPVRLAGMVGQSILSQAH
ncbi:MAG: DNA cytosine methyltransferase [Nitrospirota bacterium]|nr:DNA cytosine methyltransferase [Nitrospirota bacterium]